MSMCLSPVITTNITNRKKTQLQLHSPYFTVFAKAAYVSMFRSYSDTILGLLTKGDNLIGHRVAIPGYFILMILLNHHAQNIRLA